IYSGLGERPQQELPADAAAAAIYSGLEGVSPVAGRTRTAASTAGNAVAMASGIAGRGPWSEAVPVIGAPTSAIGQLISGAGLFGGLGGTAAAAGVATSTFGASTASVLGPLYGFPAVGAAGAGGTAAAGGLTGALGLGGGAGLFGLGAATIPVVGGLAALGFGLG